MSMTWYEYSCQLTGFIIRSVRQWEHTRSLLHMTYAMNTGEKKKKTPHEIMPLMTDPVITPELVTPEEKDDLIKLAMERADLIPKK
jgi:hypothetical protein